jgi:hypothetical protein
VSPPGWRRPGRDPPGASRSFGPAGVPVQGEAVDDCLPVVADTDGEGAQSGLVVDFHGGEPGVEVAAAGAGCHHLGECGHVPGERLDVRAAGADGLELGLLVRLEAVGAGQGYGRSGSGPGLAPRPPKRARTRSPEFLAGRPIPAPSAARARRHPHPSAHHAVRSRLPSGRLHGGMSMHLIGAPGH